MIANDGSLPVFYSFGDMEKQIGSVQIICDDGGIYGNLTLNKTYEDIIIKGINGGAFNGL